MATDAAEGEAAPPARRQRIAGIETNDDQLCIGGIETVEDLMHHTTETGERYEIPKFRGDKSIAEMREAHIKYLLESKSVLDWRREDEQRTGAKTLSGRFVDDPMKEKSRYCAREFATTKDPTVFAAASDVDATAIVDLYALKHDFPTLCFDAVAAFSQADEQELIFLECPREHRD